MSRPERILLGLALTGLFAGLFYIAQQVDKRRDCIKAAQAGISGPALQEVCR